MHPLKGAVLFSSILASLVSAAPASKVSTSTRTREYCFTREGPSPVRSVPTTTITYSHGHTYTSTSTKTPTITTTPAGKTKTKTVHVTATSTQTATTHTDTTTVTSTSTQTTTQTTTTTDTETDTETTTFSTTTTSTSTVPTSAGFTPVASVASVQQNGGGSDPGPPPSSKRDLVQGLTKALHPLLSTNKDLCPRTYPQKVSCYEQIDTYTIKTVTVTGTSTATVTGPTSSVVHTTKTKTKTVTTITTPADVTVTASSTSTTTETTTETSSSTTTTTTTVSTTTTSYAAVATVYDACASNNIIDKVGSLFVSEVSAMTAFSGTNEDDMANPVTCCNVCQNTPHCAGWFIANPGGFYDCNTIPDDGTCDGSHSVWGFRNSGSFSETFHVGDGPCGYGQYNGQS